MAIYRNRYHTVSSVVSWIDWQLVAQSCNRQWLCYVEFLWFFDRLCSALIVHCTSTTPTSYCTVYNKLFDSERNKWIDRWEEKLLKKKCFIFNSLNCLWCEIVWTMYVCMFSSIYVYGDESSLTSQARECWSQSNAAFARKPFRKYYLWLFFPI